MKKIHRYLLSVYKYVFKLKEINLYEVTGLNTYFILLFIFIKNLKFKNPFQIVLT